MRYRPNARRQLAILILVHASRASSLGNASDTLDPHFLDHQLDLPHHVLSPGPEVSSLHATGHDALSGGHRPKESS